LNSAPGWASRVTPFSDGGLRLALKVFTLLVMFAKLVVFTTHVVLAKFMVATIV